MGALSPVEPVQSSLGKYTLIEKLGEGYLGPVYRGFDQDLGRPVVVRVLCDGIKWDTRLEEAFNHECRALAELRHSNIVAIFEVGQEGPLRYIAMESLGSGTLQHLIAQNSSIPVETKISVMIQVAEGLSYAHKRRILHRDLGPGKIHLTPEGAVKIRDFAIAHTLMKHLPHPAVRFGAPIYLCPEQIQHAECDERADIFSAGTIFYELITHTHPFHDRDSNKALDNILSENQIPTFEKFPDAPPGIWMILKSCLARYPEDRFRNAEELGNACRELLKSIREDKQLMLAELYAALSPLRTAAAQPDASAKTRDLLEEIERLLHDSKEAEYAPLDRLMTKLMEQSPVIQAASSALPALSSICPQLPPEESGMAVQAGLGSFAPKQELGNAVPPSPYSGAGALDPQNGTGSPAELERMDAGIDQQADSQSKCTNKEAAVQSPEHGPEIFHISTQEQSVSPGDGASAGQTEPEKGTASPEINNTVKLSENPAASTVSTSIPANPAAPAAEGSTIPNAAYARRPPPSRYRKIPRPSYRSAAVLLSLLVIAAAGYIALQTEASSSIRKAWSVYMPGKNKIFGFFGRSSGTPASGSQSEPPVQDSNKIAGQNPAEVLMKEARALAAENRIEESKVLIRRILETAPTYQPAIDALAELQARPAVVQSPGAAEPSLQESLPRISSLINSGRLQTAKMELDRLQQAYPNAPEIPGLRKKWQNAYSKQMLEQSRKEEEQQKTNLRQKEDEWNRQLSDSLARGNYAEAAGFLTAWLSQNPGSSRAQDLNAKVQEAQRQLRAYNSAMADNRYPDALAALNNAEKQNPVDPNLAEMRRQLEARKASARAVLTVHRLGARGALLFDGRPIGKDGEVEAESIPVGNHTLTLENAGVSVAARIQEFFEGQRVLLVYDLAKQSLRTMSESDKDLVSRRRSMEEVERFSIEHDHGVFRGSCQGVLALDPLDVAYSPSSGTHGFRIPFKLLKIRVQGKSVSLLYISDNTHFQTFKFQNEQAAEKFGDKWEELKALLR